MCASKWLHIKIPLRWFKNIIPVNNSSHVLPCKMVCQPINGFTLKSIIDHVRVKRFLTQSGLRMLSWQSCLFPTVERSGAFIFKTWIIQNFYYEFWSLSSKEGWQVAGDTVRANKVFTPVNWNNLPLFTHHLTPGTISLLKLQGWPVSSPIIINIIRVSQI